MIEKTTNTVIIIGMTSKGVMLWVISIPRKWTKFKNKFSKYSFQQRFLFKPDHIQSFTKKMSLANAYLKFPMLSFQCVLIRHD